MRLQVFATLLIWCLGLIPSCRFHVVAQQATDDGIDIAKAQLCFDEAKSMFSADRGELWGKSLDGPILFVDRRSRMVVTNTVDRQNQLTRVGDVYTGRIPNDVMIANTATEWSGVKWTMLMWPLPSDEDARKVLLAHEAWHRIQDELGFPGSGARNAHLNTLDGRYLLQLEWRALASAIAASGETQVQAVTDAIAFREYRHQLFENAALEETAMELHEGLAEYTGIRVALNEESRRKRTIKQLKHRPKQLKSFVRSFAYLSGPAYGVLLDRHKNDWLDSLKTGSDMAQPLKGILGIQLPDDLKSFVDKRAGSYDAASLWATEKNRDDERKAILENYVKQFSTGPKLVLPLIKMRMSFNPNKVIPVDGLGTVYLTLTVSDEWGVLKTTGDALISDGFTQLIVGVPEDYDRKTETADWQLKLNEGWSIEKVTDGSFIVRKQTRTEDQVLRDLEKLVETEKAFADAALKKNTRQAFLKFFSDEGVVFQPAAVNAKEFWTKRPETSALLAWNPVWADISSNGEMGYTTGDWDFRPDRQDESSIAVGQYITIWKKQANGDFKAVLDIGISHEKPAATNKNWTGPEVAANAPRVETAKPGHSFIEHPAYQKLLAEGVRLYRDQKLPFIGKQNALKQIFDEQTEIKSGRVSDSKCDGTGDFLYCYGVLELTKKDDSVEKGNFLRIWKLRGGEWKITLEVFTPIPSE